MSAGGARRGRRDNGLDAAEFAVAGDVDPRIGEHLLDVLAAGGIAAYLQPSADLNPVTRTTTVPARPTDRLYVDRSHLATAQDYLHQLTRDAEPPAASTGTSLGSDWDIDREWARIVAAYHTEPSGDVPPWPAAEELDTGRADADPTSPGHGSTDPVSGQPGTARRDRDPGTPTPLPYAGDISGISVGNRPDEPSLLDGLDTFGANLPDDPEDRYIPPPPPPLPRISKYALVGVLGIIVGFALFLFPALLPIGRGTATMIGFTSIVAGFITLIWRLRPGDDEEDDLDDGAVV